MVKCTKRQIRQLKTALLGKCPKHLYQVSKVRLRVPARFDEMEEAGLARLKFGSRKASTKSPLRSRTRWVLTTSLSQYSAISRMRHLN
jgi:hypothetical protein